MKEQIRIRVVVPLTGLSEAALANRKEMLDRLREPRTKVEFAVIREGPSSIESSYDYSYAAPETLREVVRAEQDGADAAIVWCAGDANLEPARELVSIPVVGPASSAYHIASMLADRFTVLTVLDSLGAMMRRLVESVGLGNKLASVRAIDMPVLDMEGAEDDLLKRAVREAEAAIEDDGAEAIVLGCMGMLNLSDQLTAHFEQKGRPIPVVNPASASLKMAETLALMGLAHSKIAYPLPVKTEGL